MGTSVLVPTAGEAGLLELAPPALRLAPCRVSLRLTLISSGCEHWSQLPCSPVAFPGHNLTPLLPPSVTHPLMRFYCFPPGVGRWNLC